MSETHAEMPHEPAPPERRQIVPPLPLLTRGLALTGVAVGSGWLGIAAVQKSWLFAPVAVALALGGVLAAWGAAVHLTGGEKFDDHPFV